MKQISFDIDKKIRLDEFLKANHISQNLFLSIYKDDIFINGKHAKRNSKLKPGDKVTIDLKDEENNYEPINLDIEVLYEDDDIFVLTNCQIKCNTYGKKPKSSSLGVLYCIHFLGLL
ncbi:MAG: RluA family pseudouridine synthase, partial [Finegoldia magna]|nr:RluA family pseudouridine synthase [Finegoldia magna]